uniref:Ig-like domain-containing protein n=1 Tax=Xiphophorus couchianus TaxID=32473 RepID=A0A3B5L6I2_9TELE
TISSAKFEINFSFCKYVMRIVLVAHLTMSTSLDQETGFLLAHVGEKVTMRCTYEGNEPTWICWYMQTLGQKPKLMSSVFVYGTEIVFHEEFKNNSHYIIEKKGHLHYLTILDLKMSDSATYYCALSHKQVVHFGKGTTVSVKGPGFNIQASVHQLESETIQPGVSVTLNCTVQIDSCDGEHDVYWFRNTEESQPGLIYTYGSRKDQCMSNSSTKSQTCVHSLSMKNLNASHTGTYYCAVASCGHVVFGNGTMLRLLEFTLISGQYKMSILLPVNRKTLIKYNNNCKPKSVRCINGLGLSCVIFLNVLQLIFFGFYCHFQDANQDTDRIHYASINVDHSNRSRRHRSSATTECVYSKISQQK